MTVSREGIGVNTSGEIENTLGLFKISFGVSEFSVGQLKGEECRANREKVPM